MMAGAKGLGQENKRDMCTNQSAVTLPTALSGIKINNKDTKVVAAVL